MAKTTLKDPNQVITSEHDADLNAKRVVVVGGSLPEFNVSGNSGTIQTIEFPTIIVQKDIQVERIEIPVPIVSTEIKVERIEVPVFIKELEIQRVEVPVLVTEVKEVIKEIPVIVKETEYKDLPVFLRVCIAAQALATIVMLFKK